MASSETHIESSPQQLPFSIESFTYSWCINLNPPSLESLGNSLRFSLDHTLSGYFDIDLETTCVDHDHGQPRGTMECSWGPNRSSSSKAMRRCKSFMSKKVVKRYLGLLLMVPICRKLIRGIKSGKKMSSKVDALDDQGFNNGGNWRISCDSETSIYEAVLHCKRSISNSSIDP